MTAELHRIEQDLDDGTERLQTDFVAAVERRLFAEWILDKFGADGAFADASLENPCK